MGNSPYSCGRSIPADL